MKQWEHLRSSWSAATINHPAVTAMLADQAESHALAKPAAVQRIDDLSSRVAEQRDARRALEALLAATFAPGSLHGWVAVHLGRAVADALPGPTAPHAEVVAGLVVLLEQRGLVNERLFALLVEKAPDATGAVHAVAKRAESARRTETE